jgi:hypothetical protein
MSTQNTPLKSSNRSWAWWCMPIIPEHRRMRQEDHKMEPGLGYTVKLCLKKSVTGGFSLKQLKFKIVYRKKKYKNVFHIHI